MLHFLHSLAIAALCLQGKLRRKTPRVSNGIPAEVETVPVDQMETIPAELEKDDSLEVKASANLKAQAKAKAKGKADAKAKASAKTLAWAEAPATAKAKAKAKAKAQGPVSTPVKAAVPAAACADGTEACDSLTMACLCIVGGSIVTQK